MLRFIAWSLQLDILNEMLQSLVQQLLDHLTYLLVAGVTVVAAEYAHFLEFMKNSDMHARLDASCTPSDLQSHRVSVLAA